MYACCHPIVIQTLFHNIPLATSYSNNKDMRNHFIIITGYNFYSLYIIKFLLINFCQPLTYFFKLRKFLQLSITYCGHDITHMITPPRLIDIKHPCSCTLESTIGIILYTQKASILNYFLYIKVLSNYHPSFTRCYILDTIHTYTHHITKRSY